MAPSFPNWKWKKYYQKAKTRKTRNTIKLKIQEIEKSKEGLSSNFLRKVLNDSKFFLGIYPQDFLLRLKIESPAFFIINLDVSSMPGSHWIALYIDNSSIEIFDSLGLEKSTWDRKPSILLRFVEKYAKTRKLRISRKIQHDFSNFCGVFSLFFIILRPFLPFWSICDYFSENLILNHQKLLQFFQ